jgi:hypothetical protein
MAKEKKTKQTRQRKYDPQFVEFAKEDFPKGCSMKAFADKVGVTVATLYRWKERFPDFKAAVEAGRDFANIEIIESELFKNCKDRILWKKKTLKDKKGNVTGYHKLTWLQPGDVGAQKFFLMNRSNRWAEKLGIDAGEGRKVDFNIQISADGETDKKDIRGRADHGKIAPVSGPDTRH